MKIAVIGATGMVGARAVAEAVARGHEVTAATRGGTAVEGAAPLTVDMADTAAVVRVIDTHDATIVSVPGDRAGGDTTGIKNAHKALIGAKPHGRVLLVGGAGSLHLPDGTLLKDSPEFPPEYKSEADAFTDILDDYRASEGVDWTMLSPAPVIAPGERTGSYRTADDVPAGDFVSAEDFAVALVDEAESSTHRGARFTVAN